MTYDFSNLTEAQQRVLTFQGAVLCPPTKSTLQKLIDRGLIVPYEQQLQTPFGVLMVTKYEVPLPVHMAWCQHCAEM